MLKSKTKLDDYRKDGRLAYSSFIKKNAAPINKVSKTGKRKINKYQAIRDVYMKEHPLCEFPYCSKPSTECHHKEGRVGEKMFRSFMAVCHEHHVYIHDNPTESYEKGWMLKNNK